MYHGRTLEQGGKKMAIPKMEQIGKWGGHTTEVEVRLEKNQQEG